MSRALVSMSNRVMCPGSHCSSKPERNVFVAISNWPDELIPSTPRPWALRISTVRSTEPPAKTVTRSKWRSAASVVTLKSDVHNVEGVLSFVHAQDTKDPVATRGPQGARELGSGPHDPAAARRARPDHPRLGRRSVGPGSAPGGGRLAADGEALAGPVRGRGVSPDWRTGPARGVPERASRRRWRLRSCAGRWRRSLRGGRTGARA